MSVDDDGKTPEQIKKIADEAAAKKKDDDKPGFWQQLLSSLSPETIVGLLFVGILLEACGVDVITPMMKIAGPMLGIKDAPTEPDGTVTIQNRIKQLQGFLNVPEKDQNGEINEATIKAVQKKLGLPETGRIDDKLLDTVDALRKNENTPQFIKDMLDDKMMQKLRDKAAEINNNIAASGSGKEHTDSPTQPKTEAPNPNPTSAPTEPAAGTAQTTGDRAAVEARLHDGILHAQTLLHDKINDPTVRAAATFSVPIKRLTEKLAAITPNGNPDDPATITAVQALLNNETVAGKNYRLAVTGKVDGATLAAIDDFAAQRPDDAAGIGLTAQFRADIRQHFEPQTGPAQQAPATDIPVAQNQPPKGDAATVTTTWRDEAVNLLQRAENWIRTTTPDNPTPTVGTITGGQDVKVADTAHTTGTAKGAGPDTPGRTS